MKKREMYESLITKEDYYDNFKKVEEEIGHSWLQIDLPSRTMTKEKALQQMDMQLNAVRRMQKKLLMIAGDFGYAMIQIDNEHHFNQTLEECNRKILSAWEDEEQKSNIDFIVNSLFDSVSVRVLQKHLLRLPIDSDRNDIIGAMTLFWKKQYHVAAMKLSSLIDRQSIAFLIRCIRFGLINSRILQGWPAYATIIMKFYQGYFQLDATDVSNKNRLLFKKKLIEANTIEDNETEVMRVVAVTASLARLFYDSNWNNWEKQTPASINRHWL